MLNFQKDLLHLCSHALFSGEVSPSATEELIAEARNQTVFSLIYKSIPQGSEELNRALNVAANNVIIKNEHYLVDEIMGGASIPYVILKGCASADYYPEPILRTMGDVDFLVKKEDVARAKNALEANGFTTDDDESDLHYCYMKEKSVWELHFDINGIPNSPQGEIIKGYFSDVFEKSVKSKEGYVVPSHFHHGFIILLHMISHLRAGGIGLRHLCDWAVFVSTFSNEEFLDMFEESLKKVGLFKCAQVMTACSVKYLGAPEKEFSKEVDEDLVDAIIEDIFTGGNFGYKQEGREQQIKFIANRDDGTVDNKSVFSQLILTLNSKSKNKYKFIRKLPILLPIGWILIVFEYIKLSLSGARKNNDIKIHIKTARKRKEIYSKIELFKI